MIGHNEWFITLDETTKSRVKFTDHRSVAVEGIGKILIKRKDGKHSYITNVLYVPKMKNNLLSIGQFLERGYSMDMISSSMKLFDSKGRLVMKALLAKNRTFKVDIEVNTVALRQASNQRNDYGITG